MPILHIHLVEDQYSDEQTGRLLLACSDFFAETLKSPVERIRVFAHTHRAQRVAVGGRLVADGQSRAPYFEFVTLQGRPIEERHALLTGFTRILVDTLGVDAAQVRGACWPVDPENWGIGGVPASVLRAREIEQRQAAAGAQP